MEAILDRNFRAVTERVTDDLPSIVGIHREDGEMGVTIEMVHISNRTAKPIVELTEHFTVERDIRHRDFVNRTSSVSDRTVQAEVGLGTDPDQLDISGIIQPSNELDNELVHTSRAEQPVKSFVHNFTEGNEPVGGDPLSTIGTRGGINELVVTTARGHTSIRRAKPIAELTEDSSVRGVIHFH